MEKWSIGVMKSATPYVLLDAEFDILASQIESFKTPSKYSSILLAHLEEEIWWLKIA